MQTVAAGSGLTLVPRLALEVEGRPGLGLTFVPFPDPSPGRTISLAWRPASPRGAEFQLLGEELAKAERRGSRSS